MSYDLYLGNALSGCVCPVLRRSIPMLTTTNQQPYSYPVEVYDVNLVLIGIANNKQQYIHIWNSSLDNQNVGTLVGDYNPFSFFIIKNNGPVPNNVWGNPIGALPLGIIQEDGPFILTEDGQTIQTE